MRFCSSKKTGAKKPFRDLHLKGFVFVLTRLYMKELTSGRLSLAEKIVETTMYIQKTARKNKQKTVFSPLFRLQNIKSKKAN